MRRNSKAIEPIRVSKRIAEAKRVVNPIVAVEARVSKRKPKVAGGSQGITRKSTKLVPEIAHEPIIKKKKKKKIKATKKASENERGKRPFASDATQTDISYQTLYFETQKKIENLTEENYKQAIDLSYRSGQVDAYEYIIGNMKNVVTDAELNLSKGTGPNTHSLNLNHLG